jgi:hypothetical protein
MSGDDIHQAFASLAQYIAEFNAQLARNPAAAGSADRLKLAQEQLALIGDLEDVARDLAESVPQMAAVLSDQLTRVLQLLAEIWDQAVRAADNLHEGDITKLLETTRKRGALVAELQKQLAVPEIQRVPSAFAEAMNLSGMVEHLTWMLHRLAKLLAQTSAHRPAM